ncbi:hypothetical protein M9H77_27756 [Catharanthus roseus]|uniref:Uncharacterized protein n=1 Tax=Catharanthus roseus TaxID=4058 RepID=A0ACC0ADE7_CATRO|nr:hypothetical protein M9H77_27756 [Catharanthus roseus]
MRVSSAAGKSERIKTHQRSFYAPNLKEHSGSPKRGHRNQVPASRSQIPAKQHTSARLQTTALPYHWSKQATDSWGTYQHDVVSTQTDWATPSAIYALLKVDPPSESKTRPRYRKRP